MGYATADSARYQSQLFQVVRLPPSKKRAQCAKRQLLKVVILINDSLNMIETLHPLKQFGQTFIKHAVWVQDDRVYKFRVSSASVSNTSTDTITDLIIDKWKCFVVDFTENRQNYIHFFLRLIVVVHDGVISKIFLHLRILSIFAYLIELVLHVDFSCI